MNISENKTVPEQIQAEKKSPSFVCLLLLFAAVIVWFGFWSCMDIDVHHDGIMLAAAAGVANNKVIFRDVFCQYGALVPWIQSIPVKLFGAEVIVIRLTTVLFYGFVALLSLRIWGRFLKKTFLVIWYVCFFALCPFYLWCFHPWTSVYALFFMLLGLEFQLSYLESGTPRWQNLFWSGACAGAAFLCRTPCGIVTWVAGMTVMIALALSGREERKGRGMLSYAGGTAGVLLLFAFYLTVADAWADYWQQCFVFTSRYTSGGSVWEFGRRFLKGIFTDSDPYGCANLIFMLFAVLTAGMFFGKCDGIFKLDREKIQKQLPLLAVVMLTGASLHQYLPAVCYRHFWWAAIPAFGLYALTLQWIWAMPAGKEVRLFLLTLLLLPLLGAAGVRAVAAGKKIGSLPQMTFSQQPAMRCLLVLREDEEFFKRLYGAIAQLPEHIRKRNVLNHTPDGLYTCVFPMKNYHHPMFVNWFDHVYHDYYNYADSYVIKERPLVLSTMTEAVKDYQLIFHEKRFEREYRLFAPLYLDE